MCNFKGIFSSFLLLFFIHTNFSNAEEIKIPKYDWTFKGITGTFDRSALQRGYQVYTEVCASCHSMNLLSYRNLGEKGGPEFSVEQVKAIAANFEVTDGPNAAGEMFSRPARLSDKFPLPYPNEKAAQAANGGAYPPDMSVLAKARKGGVDYLYSVLLGYTEPPAGVTLDEGVYYNKFMYGNKIKMPKVLEDDLIEYGDGTLATEEQMAKDVVTFLMWSAEPHLEARHKMGFRAIIYLTILTILVYFSMKKIWSRVESEV